MMTQSLPGRDLDPGDATWHLRDGADDIQHGQVAKGDAIEWGLENPGASFADQSKPLPADTNRVSNFAALASTCVDAAIAAHTGESPTQQRAALVALKQQKIAADPTLQRRIACYESGLRKNPKLAGRVTVKFKIDRNGAVTGASDDASTLPDREVIACFVRDFAALPFPSPLDGGTVAVVYPMILNAP